jgi:hypothetical protein
MKARFTTMEKKGKPNTQGLLSRSCKYEKKKPDVQRRKAEIAPGYSVRSA